MKLATVTIVMAVPDDYDPDVVDLTDERLAQLFSVIARDSAMFVGVESGVSAKSLALGADPTSWNVTDEEVTAP